MSLFLQQRTTSERVQISSPNGKLSVFHSKSFLYHFAQNGIWKESCLVLPFTLGNSGVPQLGCILLCIDLGHKMVWLSLKNNSFVKRMVELLVWAGEIWRQNYTWLTWSHSLAVMINLVSRLVFVFQLSVIVYLYVGAFKSKASIKNCTSFCTIAYLMHKMWSELTAFKQNYPPTAVLLWIFFSGARIYSVT